MKRSKHNTKTVRFMDMKQLVDFAVEWIEQNRK